jgi:hypothetical protein
MCARVLAASCNAESGKDVLMPECLQVFVVLLGKSGNKVTVDWDRHEDYDDSKFWIEGTSNSTLTTFLQFTRPE